MRQLIAIVLLSLCILTPSDARQTVTTQPRRNFANWGPNNIRPAIIHGTNPRVRVLLPSRLDWSYATSTAALTTAPAETRLHDATRVVYQLWVPRLYRHTVAHPLVLFISTKPFPDEGNAWVDICAKHALMLATVTAGNNQHPAQRMQAALDVLDDLRRRMSIDTDRIYLAGLGDGARTASEVAFAYPEFVGGVLTIGGASSPRQEPWMRERTKERLSVAYITGGADPSRREIEALRYPVTRDLGVRTRLWSAPLQANAMPSSSVLEEAFLWLEAGRGPRRALALTNPTARMAEGVVPLPEVWARGVFEEAKARLNDKRQQELGLMQLEGVATRWRGTEAGRAAKKLLEAHDQHAKVKWKEIYNRTQQRFTYLEAKAFGEYVGGPLPARDLPRKTALLQELVGLWERVETYGSDTDEGREATSRLEDLRKQIPAR